MSSVECSSHPQELRKSSKNSTTKYDKVANPNGGYGKATEPKVQYFSISKFVDFISEVNAIVTWSLLYFDSTQMYKSKYNQICIKPVCMKLCWYSGSKYLKHKEILDTFGCQPIITFNESSRRLMITESHGIYFLNITHEPSEYENFTYYPSEIFREINKNNAVKIRSQIIKREKVLATDDIPDDAFLN